MLKISDTYFKSWIILNISHCNYISLFLSKENIFSVFDDTVGLVIIIFVAAYKNFMVLIRCLGYPRLSNMINNFITSSQSNALRKSAKAIYVCKLYTRRFSIICSNVKIQSFVELHFLSPCCSWNIEAPLRWHLSECLISVCNYYIAWKICMF